MLFLRSLAFNSFYISWTLLLGILGLPLLLAPWRFTYYLAQLWSKGVLFAAQKICSIESHVSGQEYIAAGPAIYAVKHQSAWDIFILTTILANPVFVLKKSLLNIPLVGWYLRKTNMVAIDRKRGVAALKKMQKAALETLRHGQPLIIFPEGTRTRPGEETRYHPGVVLLYDALKVPVVPIAIASGHCWGRNAFLKTPGKAQLRFLPPIPPGMPRREFMEQLQERIETESIKLQHFES